ncbi:phage tail tape measure protein [Lactobacillus amylovorus]|uniref:phage tail tape measure protein n=2 Tax=Lactobacillus TaxID=1578 RepID=UPI0021A48E5E|nr:phage tail tape measure protein [Lactobacillus amylovorus]
MRIQNVMATSIKIDTVSATQSLRSMNTALKASTNAWKAEEVQAKSVGNYLKASQARYEGLGRSIDQAKEKIKLIQERQKALDLTTEDGRNSYNRYAKQLGITVKQLSSMTAQQERAKSAMQYQTSGLASLQSRYRSLNEVNSSYVKRLEAEGKKYEAAKTRLTSYKSAVENLTKQQKIQESELSRIASESGKASSAYHAQEVKVNQTATSISKLNSKVKSAQSEVNKLNPNGFNKIANGAKHVTNAADKMKSSVKNAWEHVKSGATAAAAGIGAVGAAAISGAKKAGNLEQSYKEITNLAVTGGEKQKEAIKNVSEMQRQGRAMSIQYGKSQQDIADSYEELVKRGYTTKQALGAMRTELQASVASGDDFKDVVAVSSTTLESFGMRAKTTAQMTYNTKRAVNELAYAADMTSTGFKDLGYGMSYVGSSAHQAGFGLSQTAAAMGILSNNGLEASKAGTGLNEVINRLSTATGNLLKGDKKNALAKLGIKPKEITTSTGKLKDLSTVFGVLNKHMQGMSKVQKINIMKSLFGMTGEQAGLILTKYNKQLGTLSKQTLKAGKDGDYVAKLAKKNSETAKMQMARLKMTGEAFSMTLGAKMLPAINKAGDSLVIFLTKTKDGKKLIQDFANGVGAVANGLVNLIKWATTHKTEVKWIFGGLLTGYSVVKGAQFLQFLNKTRLAFQGLKIGSHVFDGFKALKDGFKGAELAKDASLGQKVFHGLGSAVKNSGELVKAAGRGVADASHTMATSFTKQASLIGKGIHGLGKGIFKATKAIGNQALQAGKFLGEQISKGVNKSISFGKGLFGKGKGAGKLTGLLQSARSAGGFKNLTTAGKIGTSAAGVGVAVDTATSIVKAIKDKVGSRKQYEDVGTAAGKGIGGAIGLWFGGPAGAAVGASIGAKVGKWGGDAVKSFTNGWKSKKPPKRFWSLENLGWSTKDTFTKIGKWGQGVGKKFGQGLAKGKSFAKKNAKELALTAVSPMLGIPALLYKNNPKFRKWANGVGKSIKKGLGSAKKNVSDFNKSVSKNVGNFTKSVGKKYRQFTSSVSKTFKKHWNQMYKHSSKGTKQIMRSTEKFGKNYVKINKKYGDETRKNFGSFSKRLKKNHGDLFKTIGQTTKTQLNIEKKRWTANWKNIESFAGGVWKGLTKNAGDMYKSLNAKTHGGLGKVFNGFKSFGKSIGDFWKNLWKGVKDTFDNAIKGLKDTASNVGKFFSGKLKVGNIHLAEGTDWRKKYGYPAIVNDGSDSPETNNREALIDTDGTLKLFPNVRNLKWWMLPGQHVVNAHDLATMFGRSVHLASGTFDFNLLRNYRIRDEKTPDLLNKLVKINSRRLKLSLKTYDEDKERHEKTKRRREKKDRESKKTSRTKTRKDMEYLDSSFFTGGKSTGKIVSVSKSWLKKYLESELPKKTRKRTRTTRRRPSSSRSSSSSSRRSTTTTHRERTTVSASVRGLGSVRSLAAAIKSVSGRHTARVSVSASNTKSVKSLKTALSKVKSKRIKVSVSGTKSVKSLSSALKGISKKGTLKGISSASSRLKTLSKRTKSTRSSLKGLSSANSKASRTNKTLANQLSKTSSKVKSLYKAAKKNKFGKEIKSQAEEAVKSLKGKGNFAKTFESMTKKFGKDLKSMSKDSTKEFKSMWSNIEKTSKSGENSTHKSFNTFSSSYKRGWKSLESGVSTTFDHFWTTMRKTAGKGLNKVIDVLNSGIGKIDTVISNFGGNKNAVHKVGGVHYATGTGFFGSQRRPIVGKTLAILNDGFDSPETNNREGIFDKTTGELSVVNGRNVPVVLDQRHEVFNASEMRDLGVTRHFASGTGWLKKLYEEAKKFWKQPVKTAESNFDKVTGLTGAINNLAQSAKKISQAQGVNWWSQLWKMVEDKVNDDDLGPAKGLLKAVEKLGKGKPYIWGGYGVHAKGFDCSGLVSTALEEYFHSGWGHLDVAGLWSHAHEIPKSKAKPGDPVFWLPDGHVGVYAGHSKYYSAFGPDIGMHSIFGQDPGTRGPVFGRFKGINTEGSKTSDDDVKVKTNNKLQKQIKIQVGKGFWSTIQKISDKYGEHDDGLQAGKPSGDHTHWLKQAHVPKKYWSAMNFIFTHESSWNPKAYNPQPTPTGHARGIGQLTDAQMHYVRRHGSVNNAIAQIMGAYDYMNDRYGNPDKAEAFWKAHNWYANGGIVTNPQIAVVGEGNGPETIVPWDITKRARAYRLMDRTLKHFKQQDAPTSQGEDSKLLLEILKVMTSIEKKLDSEITETRRLGEQPINVSGDFNVDGRKFARYIRTYLREFDRQTVVRGRYNLSDR